MEKIVELEAQIISEFELLDDWMDGWVLNRPYGFDALESFIEGVYRRALSFMKTHRIQAKTTEHKLEVTLSAKHLLQPLSENLPCY